MNTLLLTGPVLVPLIAAILGLALQGRGYWPRRVGILGAVVTFAVALFLPGWAGQGIQVLQIGAWPAPFGISFVLDRFAALMVAVSGLIGLTVAVYSLGDVRRQDQDGLYFPLFHLLMMGVNGAFLTGDLFNLYVWFEVLLISSFVLMTMGGRTAQFEGGFKYVAMNLVSSIFFLAALGILYGKVGTLNMADVAVKLAADPDGFLANSSAILLLCGFAIKAGLFPFFFWLPASYHTPQFAVSALFAGLLTKVGVYAMIRCFTLIFVPGGGFTHELLLWAAGMTMLTGVMGAASHFGMRRILSFHIISQIGYMVMGLALFTPLALAGTLFYLLHHIIVKTNLFLISGIVRGISGSDDLARVGGLFRHRGWLALLFFVPAFSLGGIPPLSGFWAKFAVIRAGIDADAWWIVTVGLAVGLMTLFSMTKIWAEVFWKSAPEEEPAIDWAGQRTRATQVVPVVVLAGLTLGIGFLAQPVMAYALEAAQSLLTPGDYIGAVLGIALETEPRLAADLP